MKSVIRLLIAALIIHATWRAGTVYWRHYQFRDGVRQTAQFAGRRSDQELRTQVMEIAAAYEIPLDAGRVGVRRVENHTLIDASYQQPIEILPRYFYPWEFNVHVDAYTIVPKEAKP